MKLETEEGRKLIGYAINMCDDLTVVTAVFCVFYVSNGRKKKTEREA